MVGVVRVNDVLCRLGDEIGVDLGPIPATWGIGSHLLKLDVELG